MQQVRYFLSDARMINKRWHRLPFGKRAIRAKAIGKTHRIRE